MYQMQLFTFFIYIMYLLLVKVPILNKLAINLFKANIFKNFIKIINILHLFFNVYNGVFTIEKYETQKKFNFFLYANYVLNAKISTDLTLFKFLIFLEFSSFLLQRPHISSLYFHLQ